MSIRKQFSLYRLLPNLITIASLCSGMSAIRFAILERWELAVTFLVIAAFLDGLDGRIARLLKATSNFGAQLDSLADFVCFGVSPAFVLYLWSLHEIKGLGWVLALFYAVCCCLRLARFNTSLMEEKKEAWQDYFFTGVPAPAGAMLALLPLLLTLQGGDEWWDIMPVDRHWIVAGYLPLIGVLMVSRLPTFSLKGLKITHKYLLPAMLVAVLIIAGLMIEPWASIAVIDVLYLSSLFFSVMQCRQMMQKNATDVR
jgi:CDP-diacylglycerol--serine O-phosphatidyltransferase